MTCNTTPFTIGRPPVEHVKDYRVNRVSHVERTVLKFNELIRLFNNHTFSKA